MIACVFTLHLTPLFTSLLSAADMGVYLAPRSRHVIRFGRHVLASGKGWGRMKMRGLRDDKQMIETIENEGCRIVHMLDGMVVMMSGEGRRRGREWMHIQGNFLFALCEEHLQS